MKCLADHEVQGSSELDRWVVRNPERIRISGPVPDLDTLLNYTTLVAEMRA
jgi:hypothetical protein